MGLIGGALKKGINKMTSNTNVNSFTLLFIGILVLFIKAYLVQVSYNEVVEKITGNKYKLTYMDSLFVVILFAGLI
tara:strand:+ start:97 stop:324 length:228 start_codon:yes stop_codon:yes gene_type:complete